MISAASGVAETGVLPVEVLRKSAPASMARRLASAIASGEGSIPVSRITFKVRPPSTMSRTPATMSRAMRRLPAQEGLVGQDEVDLAGAVRQRPARVVDDPLQVLAAGGEVDDGGDPHGRAFQRVPCPPDELRPDAHGRRRTQGREGLGAERVDRMVGAVVRQVGEIEASGARGGRCRRQPWSSSGRRARTRRARSAAA